MLQSRGDELKRGSKSSLLPKNEIPENISLNSDHNLNSLHKRLPNRDAFPGTYSCHHLGLLACAVETESCKTCKIPTLSQTKDLRPSQNHIKYQESKKIFESFESMTKDQQNKSELQNSLISKRNSKTETLHKYKDQITRRRRRPNWNHFDEESEIRQMQQNLLVGIEPDVMPTHPIMFFPANPDITATSRCTLINWLLEVVLHFRLHRETLYLAIHMIDRYMSVCPGVRRSFYQLLGVTALFVASKLEVRFFTNCLSKSVLSWVDYFYFKFCINGPISICYLEILLYTNVLPVVKLIYSLN